MTDRMFAISIGDSQTIYATPGPQDQDQLTELFGNSPTVEVRAAEGDTEGHGLSADITVDVEGHAIALRLPTPADAEALRKALMVGAVTATLVGAGFIASLQNPAQPASTVVDTSRSSVQGAPAQMLRAEEAQALREQSYANAQAAAQAAGMAESRSQIPTAQERADRAEAVRQQSYANSQTGDSATTSSQATADGDIAIPAPAQRADQAEQIRENAYNNQDE